MNKLSKWLAIFLTLVLLSGCGNASNYIKDNYSLIDVQGQGKTTAKIYQVDGKDVPTVANEIAGQEKPKEMSKTSQDRMFLVYDDKIINVQKDAGNEGNSIVELDTVQYAKENYDSSFLQGYVTASILQSIFGGGWFNSHNGGYDYRGYTSTKRYEDYRRDQTYPGTNSGEVKSPTQGTAPTTSDRKGSFSTGQSPSTSNTAGNDSIRRNDGSTPNYKSSSSGKTTAPSTSGRSGSFKRK